MIDPDDDETPPPEDHDPDAPPPPPPPTMVGLALGVGQLLATTHAHSRELRSIAADAAINRDAWQKQGLQIATLQVTTAALSAESVEHKRRISEAVRRVKSVDETTGQFVIEEKTAATTRRALWKSIATSLTIAIAAAGLAIGASRAWREKSVTVQDVRGKDMPTTKNGGGR